MAPQGVSSIINSSSSSSLPYRPGVEHAVQYGNSMEQAARKFQMIILIAWTSCTALIFTQRLLLREEPFKFKAFGKTLFEVPKPGLLTEKQVQKIDGILFTVNYTLLSFLMVLQFLPYGQVIN